MDNQNDNNYNNNDIDAREQNWQNRPSQPTSGSSGYYNEHGEYISRPVQSQSQNTYNYDSGGYNYNQNQQQLQQKNQQPSDYRWDYNKYENYNKEPRKKKNKGMIAFLIALIGFMIVGVIAISVIGIMGYDGVVDDGKSASGSIDGGKDSGPDDGVGSVELPGANPIPKGDDTLPASGELLTIPQVAKKVTPSVVGILRYENTLYEATGLGSGFILHAEDGYAYIVTNAHVVEYGTNFKVRLYDGAEFNAELVGADATSDIAVLKMKINDDVEITAAEIGDSEQLEVGETVVAIGNPISFDLSGSVTQGIVSAVDRQLLVGSSINYIQTDAAINPGNSGGALVNQYGQVIGINTMKVQATGYEGIGFAIPMAEALPIVNELVEFGKVASRPILGITGAEIGEMEALRLDAPMGIMVYSISENAESTPELKIEDIITHANGERIMTLADLKEQLNKFKVGDEMEITVYRMIDTVESEELTVVITLLASEE